MSEFNRRFESLSSGQRADRYAALASAALEAYDLGRISPHFIRHNGGVTYRLQDERGTPRYLLKIAQPIGESEAVPPERLVLLMAWLATLADDEELVVQEPVPNRDGELLTAVSFNDLSQPFHCTVQRWIEGEHWRGAFTPLQMYRIGTMIGRIHTRRAPWVAARETEGLEQNIAWLWQRFAILEPVATSGILEAYEWRTVVTAVERIDEIMAAMGREAFWGAVHGDLHHQNLLFHGESVRPIDFGDYRLAHAPYDLGVVWYHVMYQDDVEVRRALLGGYCSVRPAPEGIDFWPEAFMCAAALSNLSFQATLPEQRFATHFVRNVREFATVFCRGLVRGRAFLTPIGTVATRSRKRSDM